MNLVISDKLAAYIKKKHINALTVQQVEVKNCWLAPNLPSVSEGEPQDLSKFNKFDVGGITVYFNRNIVFNKETVKLDIRRYLFTHDIFVEGVDIAYWGDGIFDGGDL